MSITLKPVTRLDAGQLIQANQESRSYHAPWVQPFTDINGFSAWFDGLVEGASVSLVARENLSGGVVGLITFSQIFRKSFQNAYLGYYGMVRYARRGLMTKAVRQAVDYAFTDLELHRVEANIQLGNIASIALVRRVGFRKEGVSPRYLRISGVWQDHERWAVLADDEKPTAL